MTWNHDWAAAATCKQSRPDELFVRGAEQHKAKTVCGACPVRVECEAYVDRAGIVSGFWAGRDRTPVDLTETGGAA